MDAIGEVGIALLVLVEHVVPPIPSEVVLPFAGALVSDGRFSFAGVVLAATIGSVAGGVVLYELGRGVGRERLLGLATRVPLVTGEDVDRAERWFDRHGRTAVLTGRLVPGVRSLVSLPAGAARMPRGLYVGLTAVGSLVWNALLVGLGVQLGDRWERVERFTGLLDVVLVALVAWAVLRLGHRRWREHRAD